MTSRELGRWGLVLDAGLGVCGLLTLAGFTARWTWLGDLSCHFRVQYAAISGLLLLLCLAARQVRRAAFAGSLLVLNAVLILPLYRPAPPVPAGRAFRVLVSNVNFSNPQPERLVDLAKAEDPDIILVTELAEPAAAAMGALHNAYPFQILQTDRGAQSIGIYSRRPLTDQRIEAIGGVGWISAIATANVDGRSVTLAATHPCPPVGQQELELRNDQLQAIGEWAAEQTGPLLIAGDLNTTSWSPAWKRLTEPAGLADTRQGHGPQSTWPSFSKLFYIPLDHVLVRDLGVTGRRVLPDIGSDHRPVVVDLVVE